MPIRRRRADSDSEVSCDDPDFVPRSASYATRLSDGEDERDQLNVSQDSVVLGDRLLEKAKETAPGTAAFFWTDDDAYVKRHGFKGT